MRAITSGIATALAILVLAGCSSSPTVRSVEVSSSASAEPVTPTPTPALAEPEKNSHGNLIKVVGEQAGLTSPSGEALVEFTVTSITPAATCTSQYASASENGQFVIVDVDVTTEPKLADNGSGTFSMSPVLWSGFDSNGTTVNSMYSGPSFTCIDASETLPGSIGPGEHATGKIVFDMPAGSGSLAFKVSSVGGWEWTF